MLRLAVLFALGTAATTASERVFQHYGAASGLPNLWILDLAQDARGFIWISTHAGVIRFDGVRMERVAPGHLYSKVLTGPGGQIVGCPNASHPIDDLSSGQAVPIGGPDGQPLLIRHDRVTMARDGALWLLRDRELWIRAADGRWRKRPVDFIDRTDEAAEKLTPHGARGVFVGGRWSVWTVEQADAPAKLLYRREHPEHVPMAMRALDRADGGFVVHWVGPRANNMFRRLEAPDEPLLEVDGVFPPALSLGDSIWLSDVHGIYRLDAHGRLAETVRSPLPKREVLTMLGDREGSLWFGTSEGLIQVPEPRTALWGMGDGLPGSFARSLAFTPGRVWMASWQQLGYLTRTPSGWRGTASRGYGFPCVDRHGAVWGGGEGVFRNGRFHPMKEVNFGPCANAADGSVWFGEASLWHSTGPGEPAVEYPSPLAAIVSIAPTRDGHLQLVGSAKDGRGWTLCRHPAAALMERRAPDWQCEPVAAPARVAETPQGRLWLLSWGLQLRDRDGRWQRSPSSDLLPAPNINGVRASPSGGLWLAGNGYVWRVRETPEGFLPVEKLSTWQGFPAGALASDVHEFPDGSLWIATSVGIVEMPAAARQTAVLAAELDVRAVRVNGEARGRNASIAVPPGRHLVEVEFSLPTLRDRQLLRYQYRLSSKQGWSDTLPGDPVLRLSGLGPGEHQVALRASLDGVNWPAMRTVTLRVQAPWYLSTWGIATILAAIGGSLWLAHHLRMRSLLAAERQRARIARDLHDDLGSTLGSIGILSSLVASPDLGDEERQVFARRIAESSGEASAALQEIVWSMQSGNRRLEAVARTLSQRAYSLFPHGAPRFRTEFPGEWPGVELGEKQCRDLLLVGQEALHNAAKHAQATEVVLRFERRPAGQWRMVVEDDGRGWDGGAGVKGGHGTSNIRFRAKDLRAEASWRPRAPQGTVFELAFPLRVDA